MNKLLQYIFSILDKHLHDTTYETLAKQLEDAEQTIYEKDMQIQELEESLEAKEQELVSRHIGTWQGEY